MVIIFGVGCGFAVDGTLLVDFGPAKSEEQALDGNLGVGRGGGESFGLLVGHGPEFGRATSSGGLGEALMHCEDGLASAEDLVSRGSEEVIVVREAGLHAGLVDGKKADEIAFLSSGPDGLGWGEVAELSRSDGAREAGRAREGYLKLILTG